MTRSIVVHLALKDLYLTRWIVLASLAAGALALAVTPLDPISFYVGSVSWLCVLIVLNIFLVMHGVVQEKKDKVRLFVLSLPISPRQYTAAKMAANFTAYFIPWLVLTGAGLLVIRTTAIPDALIPVTLVITTYLLAYYCVLLGVAVSTESQMWPSAVILIGNVSINFLVPGLFRMRPVGTSAFDSAHAVWSSDVLLLLGILVFVGAAALAAGYLRQSRKRDLV